MKQTERIIGEKKNKGVFYVATAAMLWSLGGVLAKLLPWGPITIAALRGLLAAMVILACKGNFRFHLNKKTCLAGLMLMLTTIFFMVANKTTTAANAIVLQYTAPAFIILYAFLFLHKKPNKIELGAVLCSTLGIALFFVDHLGAGALFGDLCGIGAGASFGALFFLMADPQVDNMAATFVGNMMVGVLTPFVLLTDKSVQFGDVQAWIVIFIMGVVQLGVPYVLFSKGINYVQPLTASIIAAIEPILNPVWVALVVGEVPSPLALLGGIIVIATIVGYNILSSRANRAEEESAKKVPIEGVP